MAESIERRGKTTMTIVENRKTQIGNLKQKYSWIRVLQPLCTTKSNVEIYLMYQILLARTMAGLFIRPYWFLPQLYYSSIFFSSSYHLRLFRNSFCFVLSELYTSDVLYPSHPTHRGRWISRGSRLRDVSTSEWRNERPELVELRNSFGDSGGWPRESKKSK